MSMALKTCNLRAMMSVCFCGFHLSSQILKVSSLYSFVTENFSSTAIEKLIQAKTETSPVLTSFDPIHSPTAKDTPDQVQTNVPSQSPVNSASSTPSSSTKRSSRRRTMLFSSSVCTL